MTATTYRAIGTTDDVTECGICGKVELKGTVKLAVLDADGNMIELIYAGTACAARHAGRPATSIRTEAAAADKAAREAWNAHERAREAVSYQTTTGILARLGLDRDWRTHLTAVADPEYAATMIEWDAANPAPARPKGW